MFKTGVLALFVWNMMLPSKKKKKAYVYCELFICESVSLVLNSQIQGGVVA